MQDAEHYQGLKNFGNAVIVGGIITFFVLPAFLFGISVTILIIGIVMVSIANKELEKLAGVTPTIESSNPFTPVMPDTNFNGVWDTEWGEIMLVQHGIDVSGTFIGANLSGQISGRKFFFEWEKADDNLNGRGVLAIENGQLVGSWGHDRSKDNGGPIKGIPQKEDVGLVVNEPKPEVRMTNTSLQGDPLHGTVHDHPTLGTLAEVEAEAEVTEADKIEQIKQAAQEKKEELSGQIKEKVEELEEKVPEEIKVTDSFQEMKSSVEQKIEHLDEKADQAIEEVAVESSEQMEEIQEKVMMSLEDSLSKLNETLERLDKAVMSKDRENIISELAGSQMDLNLTIDRIDNTIGYGIDEALRGGKTIVGNIEGIPHPVSIKVPKSMNDFASGLKKGQKIEQKATLSSFNSIRKMLEFVLN